MNVTGVSCPFYQELYQLAHKSCPFSLVILHKQGEASSTAEDKPEVFMYTEGVGGMCVYIYIYAHTCRLYISLQSIINYLVNTPALPAISTILIILQVRNSLHQG